MNDIKAQDATITKPLSTGTRKRDTLSDTGVMRILGDYPPPADPESSGDASTLRNCPICSRAVADASSVCQHCHGYVGPAPDYLRSLQQ